MSRRLRNKSVRRDPTPCKDETKPKSKTINKPVSSPKKRERTAKEFFKQTSTLRDWVTITKKEPPEKSPASARQTRLHTFKKYGIKLPTSSELLTTKQEVKKSSQLLEKAKEIPDEINILFNKPKPSRNSSEKVHCKNVGNSDLKKYFEKYLDALVTCSKSQKANFSEEAFERNVPQQQFYKQYSSFIIFTVEQRAYLMDLLGAHFKDKSIAYLVKVLLPELMLLIFMDQNNFSKKRAQQYLTNYHLEE